VPDANPQANAGLILTDDERELTRPARQATVRGVTVSTQRSRFLEWSMACLAGKARCGRECN
jgi:hypothetical protein